VPKGVYPRTEQHYKILKENAIRGSRITKYNLPKSMPDDSNPAWRGGISDKYIQKTCIKLKHDIPCEYCGSIKKRVYHHRDCNRFNNKIKNITVLCLSCHRKLHSYIRKMVKRYEDGNLQQEG
jgi:hypothetical protein